MHSILRRLSATRPENLETGPPAIFKFGRPPPAIALQVPYIHLKHKFQPPRDSIQEVLTIGESCANTAYVEPARSRAQGPLGAVRKTTIANVAVRNIPGSRVKESTAYRHAIKTRMRVLFTRVLLSSRQIICLADSQRQTRESAAGLSSRARRTNCTRST